MSSAPAIPEIVAHRGTPRERRENTLAAFALALEQGADAIELDVHATADGVVVVHHDATLGAEVEPAALGGHAIASLGAAELRDVRLPAGPDGERHPIPTLAEVLALAADRATLYVEIKGTGIESAVLDVLRTARGPVAVHGFDHRVCRRVADVAGAPPGGILVHSYLLDPVHALRAAGGRDYWCWWEFIDAALVERVHAAGGRVVAWTVNDADAARRLAALGVDALCTDTPGATRAAIAAG
jgi:glycerophosphoryl diester phosphodiesterase